MTLAVARACEDRALKRDVVSARDLFQFFPVQLTGTHSIEHPSIVFARHKFLLFGSGSSSNLGKRRPHGHLPGAPAR
jgi:hypothetical protein